MPSYQIKFESERLLSVKNYIAFNFSAAIAAVLDADRGDWGGEVVLLEIKKVRD